MEAIKTLNINGQEVEAKGSFAFDIAAKKYATKDDKGNVTSGITNIYNKLLFEDISGVIEFWTCATAHLSQKPNQEEIEAALQSVIDEKDDTIELIRGALDVMHNSGFFKRQARKFWANMNQAKSMVAKEEKAQTEKGIEMLTAAFEEIMGEKPY